MADGKRPIITLLTDFGVKDHFVGCIKGVILQINPEVELIDISHDIPSHDIPTGAIAVRAYYSYFPQGTIHIAIVDPGVGTRRRPLLVATERYYFVVPDNGLLSFIFESEDVRRVIELTEDLYFRKPVS